MDAKDFWFMNGGPATLIDSQSLGHGRQETPGYLTIIEQLGHAFSAGFAHLLTQIAALHECQEVLRDVRHAGPVFGGPWIWKHDSMGIVDPVTFPEYGLTDLPLLRYVRQEGRLAMDHRVEKCHRADRDHWLRAGVRLNLKHSETFQPRRRRVDIAGG